MHKINLSIRERNPDYYDKTRDMETALAWNAVKKTLTESGRDGLFGHIESVRVTEKYIIIKTGKPIVNAEIKMYGEAITKRFAESTKIYGEKDVKNLRLQ